MGDIFIRKDVSQKSKRQIIKNRESIIILSGGRYLHRSTGLSIYKTNYSF